MISSKRNTDRIKSYRDEDDSSSSEAEDLDYSDEFQDGENNSKEEKEVTVNKTTTFMEEKKTIDFCDDINELSPNKENEENNTTAIKKKKSKIDEKKRRRRSSARFLHLSGNRQTEDNNDNKAGKEHDQEKLSQMYKKTLRMNAENRINVGNTWSLGLIDHLDKFLADDDDNNDNDMISRMKSRTKGQIDIEGNKERRINFTKASITLDASVKIYSYRVDDTHLSSYKVLANLNRTDNGKSSPDGSNDAPTRAKTNRRNSHRGTGEVDTLESNINNINVNKLEQDYDVDPLFHKMSKTFDEGGAKGLLLANLGVSSNGCNMLFDNSAYNDDDESKKKEEDVVDEDKQSDGVTSEKILDGEIIDETMENNETLEGEESNEEKVMQEETEEEGDKTSPPPEFDTSPFISKLKDLLNGQHISTLPLVPQLSTLRDDLTSLEKEGFVGDNPTPQISKRYATDPEEEEEAERSIHHDALERSRISACNLTYDASIMDFSGFGGGIGNEFGGNDYDDGNDDIDNEVSQVFSGLDFSLLDTNNEFSSSNNNNNKNDELVDNVASNQQKCTGRMLDLICKSNLIGVETDYQFFNDALLQKMSSGNFWAGANHWKRSKRATTADIEKKNKEKNEQPKEKVKRKKSNKVRTFVDFSSPNPASTFEALIEKSLKNKKGKSKEQLQFSDKVLYTQYDNDYILPIDAGIATEQMGQLFLRKATIKSVNENNKKSNGKHVGFRDDLNDTMIFGGNDHDDGGDDYGDGPGFNLNQSEVGFGGDYENYQSQTADDVRKINKVEVKYATVSKKVDVKRLKRDLWSELELSTGMKEAEEDNNDIESMKDNHDDVNNSSVNDDSTQDHDDANASSIEDGNKDVGDNNKPDIVSFKDTVDKIDASQSQNGITLPFYFICLLHLANEKGLRLDSPNLHDIIISADDGTLDPSLSDDPTLKGRKTRKKKKNIKYEVESDEDEILSEEGS